MRATRLLALLLASSACSCGRVGFDLLDLASAGDGTTEETSDGSASVDAASPREAGARDSGAGGSGGSRGPDASTPVDAANVAPPPDARAPDGSSAFPDGPLPREDAGTEASVPAPDGASTDAAGAPACAGALEWATEFDSDPTAADTNGDGVLDWVMRSGAPFPVGELVSGVWQATVGPVLDSRPRDDFATRTVVDVRMRSTSVPTTTRGAVLWVNVNEGGPSYSALFVSLALEADGGQMLSLVGKSGAAEVVLATFGDLPETLIDIHLDIDPVTLEVALSVDGTAFGTYAIPPTDPPNGDNFATLLGWNGTAEFDSVRIQRCP